MERQPGHADELPPARSSASRPASRRRGAVHAEALRRAEPRRVGCSFQPGSINWRKMVRHQVFRIRRCHRRYSHLSDDGDKPQVPSRSSSASCVAAVSRSRFTTAYHFSENGQWAASRNFRDGVHRLESSSPSTTNGRKIDRNAVTSRSPRNSTDRRRGEEQASFQFLAHNHRSDIVSLRRQSNSR